MRIESSSLAMTAAHSTVRTHHVDERLTIERPGRADPPRPSPPIATAPPEPVSADHEPSALQDPKLRIAIDLIERLTGRPVELLDVGELRHRMDEAGRSAEHLPQVPRRAPSQPQRPTITYDRIEYRAEEQHVRFRARAEVVTGDGRSIAVDVAVAMDRSHVERSETHLRSGPEVKDPLVVDLGASPGTFDAGAPVAFDLDADGTLDRVPWVQDGSAFLALDRNGNGVIDDGTELFGARTGDGFAELALLDDDGDGWIDEDDAAWSRLRLVTGSTEVAATQSLADAGVGAIATGSVAAPITDRDAAGGLVAEQRELGIYLTESGTAGTVRQVDLAI